MCTLVQFADRDKGFCDRRAYEEVVDDELAAHVPARVAELRNAPSPVLRHHEVLVHFFMGGLEYQVEHHLFPMAPRPNLPALQKVVRKHCADNDIPYTETSLGEAFRTIIAYLNQVGMKYRDPYTCPLVRQYRG